MGWEVSQKDGKYRIWSTNNDSWLTGWIDRNEVIKLYYERSLLDLKEKVIREYMLFPHNWCDHESNNLNRIDDPERHKAYYECLEEFGHMRTNKYYKSIDDKFDEIMKELQEEK